MSETKLVEFALQPAGVIAPTNRVVNYCVNAVGTFLRALDSDPCSDLDPNQYGFGYQFSGMSLSSDERRLDFKNWILAKGFHDLTRGIRETLEEAYVFVDVWQKHAGSVISVDVLNATIFSARGIAGKRNFPDLLSFVNKGLQEPLGFESEFLSLQKVRNCLEHRGGRVREQDIDETSGTLLLKFPRIKVFYLRDGDEIEILSGEISDTHEVNKDSNIARTIWLKRVVQEREYSRGEPVNIEGRDFFEVAFACQMFASDLAQKLPGVSTQ